MIYQALCAHLGCPPEQRLADLLPAAPELRAGAAPLSLWQCVRGCYAIGSDDQRFRRMVAAGQLPAGFDRLRRDYPGRREFGSCRVVGLDPQHPDVPVLSALGFQCLS